MGKIVPLEKIKSEEEYKEAKSKVEYYGKIYAWLENEKRPLEVIETQINTLLNDFSKKDLSDDEKRKILWQIHTLTVRGQKIQAGSLKDELRDTIATNIAKCKQYEAEKEKLPLPEIISRFLKGKIDLAEYRKSQEIIDRINSHGLISDPKNNVELQSSKSLAEYIIDNYNFVGITMSKEERTELALVKVERPAWEIEEADKSLVEQLMTETYTLINEYKSKFNGEGMNEPEKQNIRRENRSQEYTNSKSRSEEMENER